jgi:hypothetical protein
MSAMVTRFAVERACVSSLRAVRQPGEHDVRKADDGLRAVGLRSAGSEGWGAAAQTYPPMRGELVDG